MNDIAIARRYAEALFELAVEKGQLDQVKADLAGVYDSLKASADLKRILDDQLLDAAQKQDIFREIFSSHLQDLTLNFIMTVFENRRERYLGGVLEEFFKLVNASRDVLEAEIRTAVEIPEKDAKVLIQKISEITKKKINPKYKVDAEIIGGAIVKIGDKVIDGSVATQLAKLKESLMS
ncbi:ATP synthase F1 subunit delta [Bacillota bacterium LX-D]|nr:ATP synthase F1 subunit delta [Bacillota bacterium LX-D]